MRSRLVLVVLLSLAFFSTSAQITNIEKMRRWTGNQNLNLNTGLNFSYTNNDGAYIFRIGANTGVLYKFKDKTEELNNKLFLIADYNLNRSEGQDFNNNWFIHLRYNKEILVKSNKEGSDSSSKDKRIRLEAFIQTQKNQLLSINSRSLIGAGIRLKLVEKIGKEESFHLYVGTAYMYEIERTDALELNFYNHRNSSYLTATFNFGEGKLEFVNTVYYQPLYKDFQNYRLAEEFSAEIPISNNLSFETIFTYFLNNKTPIGDAEFTSHISLGLKYKFKPKVAKKNKVKSAPLW